jgi:hypothetical protein
MQRWRKREGPWQGTASGSRTWRFEGGASYSAVGRKGCLKVGLRWNFAWTGEMKAGAKEGFGSNSFVGKKSFRNRVLVSLLSFDFGRKGCL